MSECSDYHDDVRDINMIDEDYQGYVMTVFVQDIVMTQRYHQGYGDDCLFGYRYK